MNPLNVTYFFLPAALAPVGRPDEDNRARARAKGIFGMQIRRLSTWGENANPGDASYNVLVRLCP